MRPCEIVELLWTDDAHGLLADETLTMHEALNI